MLPSRTYSHFVELNDSNGCEDMLLEGIIGDDDEKRMNEMLLDDVQDEPDLERDETEDLLI